MQILVYKGKNDNYVNEDIKNFIKEKIEEQHLVVFEIKVGTVDADFVNLVFICMNEQDIPTNNIVQPNTLIRM